MTGRALLPLPTNFGTEDEGVESAPCHGEVSRCESGRSRQFFWSVNRTSVSGRFAKPIERRKRLVGQDHGVPPRMRTGIDEDTDSKSAAAQHRRGCDSHLIRQFYFATTFVPVAQLPERRGPNAKVASESLAGDTRFLQVWFNSRTRRCQR